MAFPKFPKLMAFALCVPTAAFAVECPQGMPACKVLFLSPQEEQILTQPGGILETAADARKLDYSGAAQYFKQKIKDSPQGEPKPEKK